MNHAKKVLGIAGVVTLIVAVLAVVIVLFVADQRARSNQLKDFREDIAAVGFGHSSPKWEDERKSKNHTESTLEAKVTIAGCSVELERKKGEDDTRRINGHDVERYEADEVNIGKKEIEINGLRAWPTPADIAAHLRANKKRYPCAA